MCGQGYMHAFKAAFVDTTLLNLIPSLHFPQTKREGEARFVESLLHCLAANRCTGLAHLSNRPSKGYDGAMSPVNRFFYNEDPF